tara:strand:+ start:21381 stop:22154 length:774 start_codon:yes stop_codon:yes gene_type:complete
MKNNLNLKGKTIILAGALGRIGKTLSNDLLEQGASVIALDIQESNPKEHKHQEHKDYDYQMGDVSNGASVDSLFDYGVKKYGKIDGAINTSYPRNENFGRHFFDVEYEDFCENISLHLGGYFLFMQKCAKFSALNDLPFSLVNFSSVYGVIAPKFDMYEGTDMTVAVEYAAIKPAIQHLTKYVAAYTKGSNFRVNCISPGGILDGQDPKFLERYKKNSRTKGMLDPEDLSGAVLFLCSDMSKSICGQNIIVDDGFTL